MSQVLPRTTRRSTIGAAARANGSSGTPPPAPQRACGLAPGALAGAIVLVALALVGSSCKHERPAHFTWARTPAVGRPSTCPEDAVDFGDGVPTTDQARCSYADGERDLVHVRGKVVQEVRGNIPQGLAEIDVTLVPVREDGTDGPALARATTDAQGSFSLKVYARPGKYAIVAADARRFVDVAKKGQRTFDDVQLLVPAD